MKIKVDKKEHEQLLARVEQLERDNANNVEKFCMLRQELIDYLESYLTNKCRVTMIKRDKDEIITELREQAMDNIFKKQEEE